MVLLGEQLGDFFHGAVHGQGFAQASRQATQFFHQLGLDAFTQGAAHLAQGQRQQQQPHQLRGERLGRRHTDLTPGLGQQGQVGFAHQRADAHVADRQAGEETQFLGVAQGGQGVGGFAGLGNGDE
ncbi:hypothetical protein D3C76_1184410 [compost metagenome]